MYEHVGVDEEGMYGVEVVDVTILTSCIVVEKGVSIQGSGREEVSSEEESSEGEESDVQDSDGGEESGGGQESGEEGCENRETSNAREDNVVPLNEVGLELEEWVAKDAMPDFIPSIAYDKADTPMIVGSMYPSIAEFRVALSQYAIKHEREFNIEKTDKDRVRVYCAAKAKGCKWRLHASTLSDEVTVHASIFLLITTLLPLHYILFKLFIINILLVVM
jgi:hypothetical protein